MNAIKFIVISLFLTLSSLLYGSDLFQNKKVLDMTLEVNLKELLRNFRKYNRNQNKKEYLSSLLLSSEIGEIKELKVGVQKRGKSRMENELPPLMFKFRKEESLGSIFIGHKKLKVVTTGSLGTYGKKDLIREYLLYQVYNDYTDLSFKTRMLAITFKDTSKTYPEFKTLAFLIEDTKSLANNLNLESIGKKKIKEFQETPWDIKAIHRVYAFNFLIDNDDFNITDPNFDQIFKPLANTIYPNNVKVFLRGSQLIPVAYDFDLGGLHTTKPSRIEGTYNFYFKHLKKRNILKEVLQEMVQKEEEFLKTIDEVGSQFPSEFKTKDLDKMKKVIRAKMDFLKSKV